MFYRLRLALGTLLILIISTLSVAADQRLVVVELYTSQGCNSCPPADELLGTLTGHDYVLPLALHVDYWDYIGWKDTFGNSAHTVRQKRYAAAGGRSVIYTPQMIIQGGANLEGTRPAELMNEVMRLRERPAMVLLRVEREANMLTIHANGAPVDIGPISVQLVRYTPQATIAIKRGENRGKTLTYHNIVTSWETLTAWDGRAPLEHRLELAGGDDRAAVILQTEGPGTIIAAARAD